jgi:dsDNA-specific endonuclease/ATPase MutS2
MSSQPEMTIDRATEKAMADLGWRQLVEGLAARCHTDRGAAVARALVPEPSAGPARERIAQVSEARLLHQLGGPPPFGGITDVETLVERTEKAGALEGTELVRVAEAIAGCAALRRHLAGRRSEAPLLWKIAETTQ